MAVTLGQEIDVKIIKKEGNRLDLSIKALQKTPYEEFYDAHKVGDSVTGTVFQKLPFGIIVEVAKDVRGLLHKNEFSWNPNDNYESYVKIGDEVALILPVFPDLKRIVSVASQISKVTLIGMLFPEQAVEVEFETFINQEENSKVVLTHNPETTLL